jgi:hypothetical protein
MGVFCSYIYISQHLSYGINYIIEDYVYIAILQENGRHHRICQCLSEIIKQGIAKRKQNTSINKTKQSLTWILLPKFADKRKIKQINKRIIDCIIQMSN